VNYVEPIRDKRKLEDICEYLRKNNPRNYIMFLTGIYSGLRISDMLNLKVRDVKNKDYISMREKKTRKQKIFTINPYLKKALKTYCDGREMGEYLFKSRIGANKPITREMAYLILRETAELFDLNNIGCHTLRKTFGYHHYLQYKDVVALQKIFNHSDPKITLRYIGIEQEALNTTIRGLKLF
jgi:integrase